MKDFQSIQIMLNYLMLSRMLKENCVWYLALLIFNTFHGILQRYLSHQFLIMIFNKICDFFFMNYLIFAYKILLQRHCWSQKENELVAFLQLQLAEAINLQDRALIAHLHETLRCVRLFNDDGCRKLFKSLREDYQKRSPYIAYLIRCRQGLLSTLAHLDRYCLYTNIVLYIIYR